MKNPSILIVDDDARTRKLLRDALQNEHFNVLEAANADEMRAMFLRHDVDLVTLDLCMPGEDGVAAAQKLRITADVPIVMITGRDDVMDKVLGLEIGADDYITKPFHIREFIARIRAVLRRRDVSAGRAARMARPEGRLAFDGWVVDMLRREVRRRNGQIQELTGTEFDLLKLFLTHPNEPLSRDHIMDRLKGRQWSPYDRGIDMQIRRLRQKIEADPSHPRHIKTIRGVGYLFAAAVQPAPDAPAS